MLEKPPEKPANTGAPTSPSSTYTAMDRKLISGGSIRPANSMNNSCSVIAP